VDPDDREALADAVVRAATEPSLRARLAAGGRERAAGFTWERSAELTDRLIEKLLEAG
jgi:glycosyltransferase involved in cell wall biosynthesis